MANETNTAIEVKKKIDAFGQMLQVNQDTFGAVLPAHMKLDRFIKTTLNLVAQKPDILKCTKGSILNSLLMCAELGLDPTNGMGLAYIVPFNNSVKLPDGSFGPKRLEAQLVPGYRGLILLAKRSGEVIKLTAETVYKGDRFEVEQGLDEKLLHVPNFELDRADEGAIVAVYAIATLKDGSKQWAVMSRTQVEAIRMRAPSKNSPAWRDSFGEMAKKTVIKRLAKMLTLSPDTDFAKAMILEERREQEADTPPAFGDVFKAGFFAEGDAPIDVTPPSGGAAAGVAEDVRRRTAARSNANAGASKAAPAKGAPQAEAGFASPDEKAAFIKRAFAIGFQKSDLLAAFNYNGEDWERLTEEQAANVAAWLSQAEAKANEGSQG